MPTRAAWRTAPTLAEAYRRAFRCDPVSAFGGVIALNRPLDAEAATEIVKIFTEVIIAPDASEEARAIVAAKKNLRLLVAGALPDPRAAGLTVRSVAGGFLVQDRDSGMIGEADLKVVTRRAPTAPSSRDLLFAWRVAKHVKSNAIVYAKDGATAGIGAGQMSRVDSALIAARKADGGGQGRRACRESLAKGSVVASDAFFPFRRRSDRGGGGGRHRRHPAGRLDARRSTSSPPPTSAASPWSSPACATSGIDPKSTRTVVVGSTGNGSAAEGAREDLVGDRARSNQGLPHHLQGEP